LIGGAPLIEGNQQAVDNALFAAQKAAAETLLKQGLLPPVFMDQNVPPQEELEYDDDRMDYDEHEQEFMNGAINNFPPQQQPLHGGWRGGHQNRGGPGPGQPPNFRRGGGGPPLNRMKGHINEFGRGGSFGPRGMPPRGNFPPMRGFHPRPNGNFNERQNFNQHRPRGRPCKFWMDTGYCREESRCKFLHPGPAR